MREIADADRVVALWTRARLYVVLWRPVGAEQYRLTLWKLDATGRYLKDRELELPGQSEDLLTKECSRMLGHEPRLIKGYGADLRAYLPKRG